MDLDENSIDRDKYLISKVVRTQPKTVPVMPLPVLTYVAGPTDMMYEPNWCPKVLEQMMRYNIREIQRLESEIHNIRRQLHVLEHAKQAHDLGHAVRANEMVAIVLNSTYMTENFHPNHLDAFDKAMVQSAFAQRVRFALVNYQGDPKTVISDMRKLCKTVLVNHYQNEVGSKSRIDDNVYTISVLFLQLFN